LDKVLHSIATGPLAETDTFKGQTLVEWLVATGRVFDRSEAILLGQRLMDADLLYLFDGKPTAEDEFDFIANEHSTYMIVVCISSCTIPCVVAVVVFTRSVSKHTFVHQLLCSCNIMACGCQMLFMSKHAH
jgi:Domain found in Dishevelled, Egl-10, and Pleckstrin (DEP)